MLCTAKDELYQSQCHKAQLKLASLTLRGTDTCNCQGCWWTPDRYQSSNTRYLRGFSTLHYAKPALTLSRSPLVLQVSASVHWTVCFRVQVKREEAPVLITPKQKLLAEPNLWLCAHL